MPTSRAPEAAVRAIGGTRGWFRTRDFRGVPVIAATRRIDQTGWGLVRFIDEYEALEFFLWQELRFEGLVALVVIGALAVGMLIYERTLRMARLRTQLVEAELRSLKAQLQPHFLFNALNTIAELVHEDPHLADRMITRIGDLLRLTVEEAGAQEVALRQELRFLDAYLEVERLRFRERLIVEMDIAPETLDAIVPTLILQPIVENSIRHGTAPQAAVGRITISARRRNGKLELAVRDNGRGLQRSGSGERVGVGNTRARLRQLYGDAFYFELRDHEAGGVIATITIPLQRAEEQESGSGAAAD
ncbi:MAG: histidine kinase [Chloroflexota bacterium]|nr:histidine kinase [Chloroflexota bacterium]